MDFSQPMDLARQTAMQEAAKLSQGVAQMTWEPGGLTLALIVGGCLVMLVCILLIASGS